MAKRGPRDDREGGQKARRAAGKAARKAEREVARAGAELRKIELRLVEAQVILAEVTARADALQDRLRELAYPGPPGDDAHPTEDAAAGEADDDPAGGTEGMGSAGSAALEDDRAHSPEPAPEPAPVPEPAPQPAPAPAPDAAGEAARADTAPERGPDRAADVAPQPAPGSLPGGVPGPVRPVVDLASRWGDEPF